MKVVYSKIAQEQYNEIVYYLNDRFGKEKAQRFSELFKHRLKQIKTFPESGSFFFDTNHRKMMINPYITIIYNINSSNNSIEILNFWFNRSNPEVVLQHL